MEAAVAEREMEEKGVASASFVLQCAVARGKLNDALVNLIGVVEKRNTIPILSNILIRTKKQKKGAGELLLKVTDLEREASQSVPADVFCEGELTVPAHTFFDIVRNLQPAADIKLVAGTSSKLLITSGRSKFELHSLPAEDFPKLGNDLPKASFEVDGPDLFHTLKHTAHAMSDEETRYYLIGIYFHVREGKLCAVATDGHRLGRVEVDCPVGAEGISGVIIPSKTVTELLKLLNDHKGPVQVTLDERQIEFAIGETRFLSKLIDGTYPDYQRVIPTQNKKSVTVDPKELFSAVKRVSRLSSEKGHGVKFNFNRGTVTLSAQSSERGSASEEIDTEYRGDPIEIGFNSKYVRDIIELIDGDAVEVKLHDASSPALITDSAHENLLYVLMPMRV